MVDLMPSSSLLRFALTALAIALGSGCAQLPTTFPRFEDQDARPALVVGTIEQDRYLDALPECELPDVMCMDPPPLLLTVRISRTLYGPKLDGRRHVATTSHYGRGTHLPGSGNLVLLAIKVHGQDLVLPRYAMVSIERTSAGDLAVPDWDRLPVWWLPCSVVELRESIEFAPTAARAVDGLDVDELCGLVSVRGSKALPLFGIRLARIAEHLATLNPSVTQMSCERALR